MDRPTPRARVTTWILSHQDLVAVVVLGVIPVVWYGIPAAVGRPALPGDDLLQNYPLRVLVGQQLRHGALPVYDQYIWGGAPLLGGWNAGALYPFTFLFAVLPNTLAWFLNEVVVYWVAAIGLHAFLRTLGRRPLSSALAGASFAFAGALDVQLAHFGLVAGTSWTPLILLGMVRLTRSSSLAARARWSAVLGVLGALVVLAGEPRAITTVVIIAGLYFVWLAVRQARPVVPFVVAVGIGVALALMIGAVQWLPGTEAVRTSQRALNSYTLYGSGSLPLRWLSLGLVPILLGGSGSFGSAGWFAGYNLTEVMSYVGLLPVVGAFGLLGTLRRRKGVPEWLIWHVVAVVGILLAVGSFTPLGHVFVQVPLFGGQRLQSRNIAITDFALAVLLAYWVDHLLDRRRVLAAARGEQPSGLARSPDRAGRRPRVPWWGSGPATIGALVPALAATVAAVIGAVSPATVAHWAGATVGQATQAVVQRPLYVAFALLAAAVVVLVRWSDRMVLRRLGLLLVVVVTVDLVFFNLTSNWAAAVFLGRSSAPAAAPTGASTVPLRLRLPVGRNGRFVIYRPNSITPALLDAGEPDLNLLDGTFSAQGYSSIVDGTYATATGSHLATGEGTNALSPVTLVDGVFDSLDTTTLITYPEYLVVAPPATGTEAGRRTVPAGGTARWVFGEQLDLSSVRVRWTPRRPGPAGGGSLRLGLEAADGTVRWQPPTPAPSGGTVELHLDRPTPAVAVEVTATRAGHLGAPALRTEPGATFFAAGSLQDTLDGGHWSFVGDQGPLAFFVNNRAQPPLTLEGVGGGGTTGATVRALGGPTVVPSSARVSSPHGVAVVRSVAAIPGWSATWRPSSGGRAVALAVRRTGVVQIVAVPAGTGVLAWHYSAPGLAKGTVLALAGVVALLVLLAVPAVRRSKRLPRPRPHPRSHPVPGAGPSPSPPRPEAAVGSPQRARTRH